jgi:hypothetical protein
VLPVRSLKRGEEFKKKLLTYARERLVEAQSRPFYNGHAQRVVQELVIDILYCDLSVMKSVLEFSEELWQRCVYSLYFACSNIITDTHISRI